MSSCTVGRIGERFGLSRSTLLYYDRIGLLCPAARSPSGYRLYSASDQERLRRIMVFRSIGVPLEKIREILDAPERGVLPLLLRRIFAINDRIEELRGQQRAILGMLEEEGSLKGAGPRLGEHRELGRRAGIHEGNAGRLHRRVRPIRTGPPGAPAPGRSARTTPGGAPRTGCP